LVEVRTVRGRRPLYVRPPLTPVCTFTAETTMCAESIVTRLTDRWTSAVLKLGHGRGFVVSYGEDERAIITDAHCLPTDEAGRLLLPPAHKMSHEERIYPFLLARIGGAEAIVEAQCLFVDPIADIAVLGPSGEEGSDRFNAYQKVVNDARTLSSMHLIGARPGFWRLTVGGSKSWWSVVAIRSLRSPESFSLQGFLARPSSQRVVTPLASLVWAKKLETMPLVARCWWIACRAGSCAGNEWLSSARTHLRPFRVRK